MPRFRPNRPAKGRGNRRAQSVLRYTNYVGTSSQMFGTAGRTSGAQTLLQLTEVALETILGASYTEPNQIPRVKSAKFHDYLTLQVGEALQAPCLYWCYVLVAGTGGTRTDFVTTTAFTLDDIIEGFWTADDVEVLRLSDVFTLSAMRLQTGLSNTNAMFDRVVHLEFTQELKKRIERLELTQLEEHVGYPDTVIARICWIVTDDTTAPMVTSSWDLEVEFNFENKPIQSLL